MSETKSPEAPSSLVQPTRREFIHLTAGAMGIVGAGAAAWPFINSMNPSADVMALSTLEVDISGIQTGQTHTVMWRGRPVFVRHRTENEIKEMRTVPLKDLKDPQTDEQRAKDPNWLVVVGVCTHLGCIPTQRKAMQGSADPDIGWICACHGSQYDYSGRVISGPAPKNLEVPVYEFINPNTTLKIG